MCEALSRPGRVGGLAGTCGRAGPDGAGGDVWEGPVCEALSRPGRVGGLAGSQNLSVHRDTVSVGPPWGALGWTLWYVGSVCRPMGEL